MKPDYESWTAMDKFACLKNNHLIDPDDNFFNWASRGDEMTEMLKVFFEQ